MPDKLTSQEAYSKDPSVTKQYDNETSKDEQITDFYGIVDKLKIGLLTTHRDSIGLISRSMATAKREGPDFYFLCNKNSKKYQDLKANNEVLLTFQDSSTQTWVSISGKATVSTDDPKIKDLYSKPTSAWFGDLGDGIHDGGPNDPRMTMIKVKSHYISYYKTTVGAIGYAKEIAVSTVTGKVADTGLLRELGENDIAKMRTEA